MSLRNLLDPKTKVSGQITMISSGKLTRLWSLGRADHGDLTANPRVSVSATAPGTSRKAILNDSEEPWTGPSLPSHIHLTFPSIEGATHLALTFQGGFVGTRTEVWTATDGELELSGSIYPDDKSRRQVFPIPTPPSAALTQLKLVFTESSDNQGRITVYQVELLG